MTEFTPTLKKRITDLEHELAITKVKLEDAEHELLLWYAVQGAGVDNWEGWDSAIEALLEDHPDYFGD